MDYRCLTKKAYQSGTLLLFLKKEDSEAVFAEHTPGIYPSVFKYLHMEVETILNGTTFSKMKKFHSAKSFLAYK